MLILQHKICEVMFKQGTDAFGSNWPGDKTNQNKAETRFLCENMSVSDIEVRLKLIINNKTTG